MELNAEIILSSYGHSVKELKKFKYQMFSHDHYFWHFYLGEKIPHDCHFLANGP